jgi:predicted dehydrogenase
MLDKQQDMTDLRVTVRKIAVCGVSNRAIKLFIGPLAQRPHSPVRIAALLDPDPLRFDVCKRRHPEHANLPCYREAEFQAMLAEVRPDALYVSGIDNTHTAYILAGLEAGLDVVVEKPMVTTWTDCLRVLEAERSSTGRVYVAFNFRYAPLHQTIKKLLRENRIGKVLQVNMEYYLDPFHGASYFKRWHRARANSGGLAVHKACHHFDLIGWWLEQAPHQVSAFGALNYYGPDSEHKPSHAVPGLHCSDCTSRSTCSYDQFFQKHLGNATNDGYTGVRNSKEYGTYRPDACIFDPAIDIEDTYIASVRFSGGTMLSYSLNFSAPFEGYRLSITGTHGRLETQVFLHTQRVDAAVPEGQFVQLYGLFGGMETIEVPVETGGHLGGDSGLLRDLVTLHTCDGTDSILAGAREGAISVAVGDAINRSIREQQIITIPPIR